jgi:hypothetical protein
MRTQLRVANGAHPVSASELSATDEMKLIPLN